MNQDEKFIYTYSAKQQEEIKAIRQKYINEEDNLTKLKKIDQQVSSRASICSITFGIISTLIFGLGLTCVLKWQVYILGIIISLFGLLGACLAYFLHDYLLNKLRKKYAPIVIELTDQLLK